MQMPLEVTGETVAKVTINWMMLSMYMHYTYLYVYLKTLN